MKVSKKAVAIILCCVVFTGCVDTYPKDFLKVKHSAVQNRQIQMRRYDTTDEASIMAASAGVLQDLGFTLDSSETNLGLIAASKDRDATDGGQVALATLSTVLSALGGSTSNAYDEIDKEQKIRASVITRLSEDKSAMVVRVTFQRIVWKMNGQVSRMETLDDAQMYAGFFDQLSKAIFLEAHQI